MNWKLITGIFIGLIVIACLGYDIFALIHGGDMTISEWFWANSKKHPFIPFCFGVLAGHLFAQES